MNTKQRIVLWIMVLLLSATSAAYGLDYDDPLWMIAVPTILIGGMLFLQFQDSQHVPRDGSGPGNGLPLKLLLVMNAGALTYLLLAGNASATDSSYVMELGFDKIERAVEDLSVSVESTESFCELAAMRR